jgi:hypothetical protein
MANVQLTGNFLATARCLIFADGGGITWTFNSNTNTLQASGSGGGVTGLATPTAKVGLTAVAGSLLTAMRSDGAPPIDQAITPTWTGLHTFNAGFTVGAGVVTISGHTLALSANATVGGTNTGDQVLPSGGNPGTSIGLNAVNGVAVTFMRSDGAPALSQAITPTWTGLHTFSGATPLVVINATGAAANQKNTMIRLGATGNLAISSATDAAPGTSVTNLITGIRSGAAWTSLAFGNATDNPTYLFQGSGTVSMPNALGVNGNAPPAQSTGWGTPTGGSVQNNYTAGVSATLLSTSDAVAQIITVLKAVGFLGA